MSMPKIECEHVDKCCVAASLVQSVALEEAALSHILNAEGEKIQKVLSMHDCKTKDLLEVNKSVRDMVDKITALQIVLKSKLDVAAPLFEECKEKHHKAEECDEMEVKMTEAE